MTIRMLRDRVRGVELRRARPPEKVADPHYATSGHREWARGVLARAGWQCQDPAHDPLEPRGGRRLYADHIRELKDGGDALDPANGLCRCASCHTRKTLAVRGARMGAPT